MNLLRMAQALVNESMPIRICKHDDPLGSRLGGLPPCTVQPTKIDAWTEYFATILIDTPSRTELSIFLSGKSSVDLWNQRYRLFDESANIVQLVIHPAQPRAMVSPFPSALSAHALRIEEKSPDEGQGSTPAGYSKIGGKPYYFQEQMLALGSSAWSALNDGYFHFVQFAFPMPPDAMPSGNWPFGEWAFHIFAKQQRGGQYRFLFCWG